MGKAILGKVVIRGKIKLKTGLHIGAQTEAIEIGGIDNPVIKDPLTGKPYIPGSTLKGKMRSLLEKTKILEYPPDLRGPPPEGEKDTDKYFLNRNIGTAKNPIWIHIHNDYDKAKECEVCRLFGSSGKTNHPARVIFRDAHVCGDPDPDEIIEIKYETGIDRITSAANPRPMERVVPGTEFKFEIVYNVEDENDKKVDLENLINLMKMLEDDYLGGSGSRGYGKVEFKVTEVIERSKDYYFGNADQNVIFSDEEGKRPEEVLLEISGKL